MFWSETYQTHYFVQRKPDGAPIASLDLEGFKYFYHKTGGPSLLQRTPATIDAEEAALQTLQTRVDHVHYVAQIPDGNFIDVLPLAGSLAEKLAMVKSAPMSGQEKGAPLEDQALQ